MNISQFRFSHHHSPHAKQHCAVRLSFVLFQPRGCRPICTRDTIWKGGRCTVS